MPGLSLLDQGPHLSREIPLLNADVLWHDIPAMAFVPVFARVYELVFVFGFVQTYKVRSCACDLFSRLTLPLPNNIHAKNYELAGTERLNYTIILQVFGRKLMQMHCYHICYTGVKKTIYQHNCVGLCRHFTNIPHTSFTCFIFYLESLTELYLLTLLVIHCIHSYGRLLCRRHKKKLQFADLHVGKANITVTEDLSEVSVSQ